jgi:hypothetical protein
VQPVNAGLPISSDGTELRFSPRPAGIRSVRKFTWSGSGEYIEDGAGAVETREWQGHFITEFESSDQLTIDGVRTYEVLRVPFTPRRVSGAHCERRLHVQQRLGRISVRCTPACFRHGIAAVW